MKTIFLSAGNSSRVYPIEDKNLLEFGGKPLIIHLLENAKKGGLENFVIVVNKNNADEISQILQDYNFSAEIVIQSNTEEGMAGGVLAGLEKIEENEEVFILGGNDFVDFEIYSKILRIGRQNDGAILAKTMDKYFPGGYLQVDENSRILSIVEKPKEGTEPSKLVNMVAHFFKNSADLKSKLLDNLSKKIDGYELTLQSEFTEKTFLAVDYSNFWQAIKYPWHILEMMNLFFRENQKPKISSTAEVSDKSTLIGKNIFIDDGVKIMNGATIVSPCYIGKNSVIGQNTLIRESNIGANSMIGFGSEICRSFLAKNVFTHNAYIGDSIIDENVNFGIFSATTNLRLDKNTIKMKIKNDLIDSHREKLGCVVGRNSQIGSGAKIMPGRILASDSLIAPNTIFK